MGADHVVIRREESPDREAIFAVNELAFGRAAEALLVERLRAAGATILSLVAEVRGRVIGHVLFTPVSIAPSSDTPAGRGEKSEAGSIHGAAHDLHGPVLASVGLAPMAVLPEHQRIGVGSRLVRHGLGELRVRGHESVFVLGHPDYYPRLGFVPAERFGIRWERECPAEAFMAIELREGALAGRSGVVRYRPEFDEA
jgi:putative acetyltransferase